MHTSVTPVLQFKLHQQPLTWPQQQQKRQVLEWTQMEFLSASESFYHSNQTYDQCSTYLGSFAHLQVENLPKEQFSYFQFKFYV